MNLVSKTIKPLLGAAAVAAISAAVAQPADALTFSVSPGTQFTSTVSGATTIDFNEVVPNLGPPLNYTSGIATYTGMGQLTSGSIISEQAQPPNNQPAYLTLGAPNEPGPVTINFGGGLPLDYFGLYWGSIDSYNFIDFFNGDTPIASFSGSQITAPSPANGNQTITGARFVNFFAQNRNQWFNRVVLRSNQAAFESDNHAFRVVPTPALVPAALGFGAAMLRKRKEEQKEEAGVKA